MSEYSFTQPICDDCWDAQAQEIMGPGISHRRSPRLDRGEEELCAHCGRLTRSGIYIRVDPSTIDYPTKT